MDKPLKDFRPYEFRMMLEYINDNLLTPHIAVDCSVEGVDVPRHLVDKHNQIVLNLSMSSLRNYHQTDEFVMFSTRFNKIHTDIVVPMKAIRCIFARERMDVAVVWEVPSVTPNLSDVTHKSGNEGEVTAMDDGTPVSVITEKPTSKRPTLRIVK